MLTLIIITKEEWSISANEDPHDAAMDGCFLARTKIFPAPDALRTYQNHKRR
jgi:hypothetical protein